MELINAILSNKKNLRTIVSVVHPIIKKDLKSLISSLSQADIRSIKQI